MSCTRRSRSYVGFVLISLFGLAASAGLLWAAAPEESRPGLKGAESDGPNLVPTVRAYLFIEPIAGLTTVRHLAPDQTAIPLGTELGLFLSAPGTAEVTFTGATITSRNAQGVWAACSLSQVGRTSVDATVRLPDGASRTLSLVLDVVAITPDEIAVTGITASVKPFDLDETATNGETMAFYMSESIAMLQPTSTGYRTSTNRRIRMVAELNRPEFLPVMEWRVGGAVRALGAERQESFATVGNHTVSVGPPDRSAELMIETYSVSITSHESGAGIVGEGKMITFEAVTDPLGFEDDITWLSSTKSGSATPVVGYGPTFTAEFNDTFGPNPGGGLWQWLGVKADNATFGQDQKVVCEPPCAAGEVCAPDDVELDEEGNTVGVGGANCKPEDVCHLELDVITNRFVCTPPCPTLPCELIGFLNAQGLFRQRCDCICPFNALKLCEGQLGAAQCINGNAAHECVPTKIRRNVPPPPQMPSREVRECTCLDGTGNNTCHVTINAQLRADCIGSCPSNTTCTLLRDGNVIPEDVGGAGDYTCECR